MQLRRTTNLTFLVVSYASMAAAVYGGTIFPPSVADRAEVCFNPCQTANGVGDPVLASISRGSSIPNLINVSAASSMEFTEAYWKANVGVGGSINQSGFGAINYSSYAIGTLFDNLTIPTGSYLIIPIHLTGSVNVSFSAPSNLPPGTVVGATVTVSYRCQVNGFSNGTYLPGSDCSAPQLNFTSAQQVDQMIDLKIPFIANQPFTLELDPSVKAVIGIGGVGGSGPYAFTAQARGAFDHTAVLEAAQVYDSNDNLLSNIAITSDSGFSFTDPPGASAVPEPASFLLLPGGLGLVALLRARRNRSVDLD